MTSQISDSSLLTSTVAVIFLGILVLNAISY
jgi:hypothetical protein